MTMREQEVGVFDFVLLDEVTLEKFMQNLRKRYVDYGCGWKTKNELMS